MGQIRKTVKQQAEVTNRLAAIRKQRGVPAAALAEMTGVSRQTIYAVEAGSYVPNTAVGLRLAQVLGVRLEDLFSLTAEPPAATSGTRRASLLPPAEELQPGQAVQLCDVNGRLVAAAPSPAAWYRSASDGVIGGKNAVRGLAQIHLHESEAGLDNRLLLAGCDPAMGMLASYLQSAGVELVLVHQNSLQSLALLKSGLAHMAGSHLRDHSSGGSNVSVVNRLFPARSAALVSFAVWQEGLVTATRNPKRIQGVPDLTRKDVTFVNRETGSGSRALLESHLKRLNLEARAIRGYLRTAPGHLAAAWEVKKGDADCCVATESSARCYGLHFIPLQSVRYDLVVRAGQLGAPGVQILLNLINELSFRRKLQSLGGYDTSVTGARVQ